MADLRVSKSRMSLRERDLRSRLVRMIAGEGLMRGTLDNRARTCGKSRCKCVRGEKHISLYVVASEGGRLRHLYVPGSHVTQVEGWVEAYQKALALLEEISQLHWKKVQEREE
jgi:hypothetical protein